MACAAGIAAVIIISILYKSPVLLLAGTLIFFLIHQAFYIYGMFSPGSNFFFKTVKGKEFFNDKKGILFRFDDGPDPVYTPQILDILKSEGIRALFAVTGSGALKYPDIVKRIQAENHIIGNHTFSHPYNILLLSYNRVLEEVSMTNTVIRNITGTVPKYFCPPIGFKNHVIGRVIKKLELLPVMWDIRTLDTQFTAEKIILKITKELKSPAIIMFHDGILPLSRKDREPTLASLKKTIELLKEKQYL